MTVFSDGDTTAPEPGPPPAAAGGDLLLPQEMVDPLTLTAHPGNPRQHNDAMISESLREFGLYQTPTMNKRTGQLIRGHGTVNNFITTYPGKPIQVSVVDVDQETATRILLMDNQSSDTAKNDDRLLAELLADLPDLDFTGYGAEDLTALEALLGDLDTDTGPGDGGADDEEPDLDDKIALAGVVVGEPPITTKHGDIWSLGDHHLIVGDVHTDWHLYVPLLKPGHLFWPYPTLLAPFANKAKEHPVVMVQPSPYLAGWLLTKWQRVTGHDPIRTGAGGLA